MAAPFHRLALFTALLVAALAGCSEGRKPPPKTTVTVVNAAPTQGAISFLREQHVEATLNYREASSPLLFDEDQYDFNIETSPPGAASPQLIDSFSQQVVHGTDYLIVLTEAGGSAVHLVLEKPPFSSTSETEARAVHAAPAGQPVDVFITAPDADLAAATPIGSVAFEQATDPLLLAPGDYVLTLTEAGNPANVLFASAPFTLGAGASNAFVITGDGGEGLAPYSVVVAGTGSGQLFDKNAFSGVEIVNAAADGAPRDVYLDADFSAPIAAAIPGNGVTMQLPVAAGTRKLTVTPAGNPGVVEAELSFTATATRRQTALIAGDPGGLKIAGIQDDPRPVVGESKVRFMNGATLFTGLAFFIVQPGVDVLSGTVSPVTTLTPAGLSARFSIPPGTYDVVLGDPSTSTVVAGPQSLTFSDGGLYTILATNGAGSGTANIVPLQGFE